MKKVITSSGLEDDGDDKMDCTSLGSENDDYDN